MCRGSRDASAGVEILTWQYFRASEGACKIMSNIYMHPIFFNNKLLILAKRQGILFSIAPAPSPSRQNTEVKQRRVQSVLWTMIPGSAMLQLAFCRCHRPACKISGVESPFQKICRQEREIPSQKNPLPHLVRIKIVGTSLRSSTCLEALVPLFSGKVPFLYKSKYLHKRVEGYDCGGLCFQCRIALINIAVECFYKQVYYLYLLHETSKKAPSHQ